MPGRRRTPELTEPLPVPEAARDVPLAARMRPRGLDEFVGQPHLVGDHGALTRVAKRDYLPSMVLWGPPGSGKTTLARLLAERSGGAWRPLSAVTSGVADVRALVAEARARREAGGRTVAFIDELHRFNKSQQDALLPHVEEGTITLIGATTENPYYEINSPLLSRLRVYRLEPLDTDALNLIVDRALADPERGLGGRVSLTDAGRSALLDLSGGDGRQALNIVESAAAVARDGVGIGPEAVAEAAQQRLLEYDRVGDQHYEAASAFIKSMRGNDPDAALYWCASMIAAGEDPTFIARRIVIAASEDVGNADPRALGVAVAAMQATEMIGLPECQYALAQAAAYVASAPKSNRVGAAYFAALADVEEHGRLPVPLHLRPSAHRRLAREHGYGRGYLYPHDFEEADVEQQYLPDALAGRAYYEPSDQGLEAKIGERLARLRRARFEARRGSASATPGADPARKGSERAR
ncbi:MAG: replication-associated recombination protein A [Candidatus Limnocylindria bacterium]